MSKVSVHIRGIHSKYEANGHCFYVKKPPGGHFGFLFQANVVHVACPYSVNILAQYENNQT